MTVQELSKEQYKELCQAYITEFWVDNEHGTTSPSMGELVCADELVAQDVIFNHYEGINFTDDDFFCTAKSKYIATVDISRKDFDRINKLFDVEFENSDVSEMEELINQLDARRDTMPYSFYFQFDDDADSYITLDICSGNSNYYDNVVFCNDNQEEVVFECAFQLDEENEYEVSGVTYICKFNIIEEE